ncbi:hypothetical protein ACFYP0_14635 [Micromonospora arida]|uniref:hypothetical protein n=1 Tax=Micromonospora arida TaxID=2203715 RepID=UPI0036B49D0C
MTGRGWKIVGWVAGIVAGLGVTGVGVFFGVTGVEDANRWSGVLGFFVGVLGLAVAIYSAALTRRSLTPPTAPPPSGGRTVGNTISGGTFHQPAVQARDIIGLSIGSPAPPAGPPPTQQAGAGDVRNTISGGTFHQPAVQARDITGLSSAQPGTGTGPVPGAGPTT